jgi:hypothetical protein
VTFIIHNTVQYSTFFQTGTAAPSVQPCGVRSYFKKLWRSQRPDVSKFSSSLFLLLYSRLRT